MCLANGYSNYTYDRQPTSAEPSPCEFDTQQTSFFSKIVLPKCSLHLQASNIAHVQPPRLLHDYLICSNCWLFYDSCNSNYSMFCYTRYNSTCEKLNRIFGHVWCSNSVILTLGTTTVEGFSDSVVAQFWLCQLIGRKLPVLYVHHHYHQPICRNQQLHIGFPDICHDERS